MIDANAEVIGNRIAQEGRSAAGITSNAIFIGRVDALHSNGGNINPQVARDGDHGHLSITGPQDDGNHCIGAEGGRRALIVTDQQEIEGVLVGQ